MEIIFKECESEWWLAWYKERDDILANGETKDKVIENLTELYSSVMEYEMKEADCR